MGFIMLDLIEVFLFLNRLYYCIHNSYICIDFYPLWNSKPFTKAHSFSNSLLKN